MSPFLSHGLAQWSRRYSVVMPFSMMAAACSSLTPFGHMHELLDAHHALLAVGAQHAAIGDAIALLEAPGLRADFDDHAGRLAADGVGHRRLVEARARIDVDEVEADRGVLDLHLAGAGRSNLDILELHLFRSAILMHQDRFRHFLLPVVANQERPSAKGVEYSEGLRRVDCTDAKSSWLQPRHYPRHWPRRRSCAPRKSLEAARPITGW